MLVNSIIYVKKNYINNTKITLVQKSVCRFCLGLVTANMMRHITGYCGSGGERGTEEADLLSFWAAGLVDGPAVVRPTGLECLGPLPGIFKPLDFSMFIMSTGETSSFAAY